MKPCGQTVCATSKHHKRSSMPFSEQPNSPILTKISKHPSFSCICTSNFQSEAQFKVNSCLKANPLLTIMQCNKATMQWWGDVLTETQLLRSHQLPTRDGCSEPGPTFFQKDKPKYSLAFPNCVPSRHSPPQTWSGKYSDLGSKTVGCEPRWRL